MKLLSKVFLLIALLCFLYSANQIWKRYNPTRLSFSKPPINQIISKQTHTPLLLSIDSIHVSLPIIPAIMKSNVWVTTDKGVSYLTSSPLPGEKGNSIIYGHNFTNILGNLPKVKPGQKIIITFDDLTKQTFVVDKTTIVEPTNASVLANTTKPSLTIYTCTGFLDSKRFVVRAIPQT